jgi:hypothetical protein
MAITEDAILDRIRDLLTALQFTEAAGVWDFKLSPTGAIDQAFAVRYVANPPIGGMGYREEARGIVTIQTVRSVNGDLVNARRLAFQDSRTILAGLIEDGHVTSGEYAVEDASRAVEVVQPKGANYLVMTLGTAINFDALLTA